MRFAHSLNFPHLDLMLEQLSAEQYRELLAFFRVEAEERERLQDELQERRVMNHLAVVAARQKRERNG